MEVVLGIDNIVFISILTNKLPKEKQASARRLGLAAALVIRVILLFFISYIVQAKKPLFTIFEFDMSTRDLILLLGGLFLLAKSTSEIHHKVSGEADAINSKPGKAVSVQKIIFQIILLDIVFSFDSILTAVGLSDQIIIMVLAVVISMIVMLLFAGKISNFVNNNPTIKILALSFLLMIGFMLIIEAFHVHVPKGYLYFGMAFSLGVELLNLRVRKASGG